MRRLAFPGRNIRTNKDARMGGCGKCDPSANLIGSLSAPIQKIGVQTAQMTACAHGRVLPRNRARPAPTEARRKNWFTVAAHQDVWFTANSRQSTPKTKSDPGTAGIHHQTLLRALLLLCEPATFGVRTFRARPEEWQSSIPRRLTSRCKRLH